MKDKLTIEQSQELINLGVPTEKASEVYIIEGFMGNCYRACFTLTDALDLLPTTIIDNASSWPLMIKRHENTQWSVGYGQVVLMLEKELIDAAFGLIKWLYNECVKPISK